LVIEINPQIVCERFCDHQSKCSAFAAADYPHLLDDSRTSSRDAHVFAFNEAVLGAPKHLCLRLVNGT